MPGSCKSAWRCFAVFGPPGVLCATLTTCGARTPLDLDETALIDLPEGGSSPMEGGGNDAADHSEAAGEGDAAEDAAPISDAACSGGDVAQCVMYPHGGACPHDAFICGGAVQHGCWAWCTCTDDHVWMCDLDCNGKCPDELGFALCSGLGCESYVAGTVCGRCECVSTTAPPFKRVWQCGL